MAEACTGTLTINGEESQLTFLNCLINMAEGTLSGKVKMHRKVILVSKQKEDKEIQRLKIKMKEIAEDKGQEKDRLTKEEKRDQKVIKQLQTQVSFQLTEEKTSLIQCQKPYANRKSDCQNKSSKPLSGHLSPKFLLDQETFKFSGTIQNDTQVEIKIDFENKHSISLKGQKMATEISQDIKIDASGLCEDEKQATFKFTFNSKIQRINDEKQRDICGEELPLQSPPKGPNKEFLIFSLFQINKDENGQLSFTLNKQLKVENPWLGDQPLNESTWDGQITHFFFELSDSNQLLFTTINLENLEVLKSWKIDDKIRNSIDLPFTQNCGYCDRVKRLISYQQSALLNTFFTTCRFKGKGEILYFNLWPGTFIQYDLTSGTWEEEKNDGTILLPIEQKFTQNKNQQFQDERLTVWFVKAMLHEGFGGHDFVDQIAKCKQDMSKDEYVQENLKVCKFYLNKFWDSSGRFDELKPTKMKKLSQKKQDFVNEKRFAGDITQLKLIEVVSNKQKREQHLKLQIDDRIYWSKLTQHEGTYLDEQSASYELFNLKLEYCDQLLWLKTKVKFFEGINEKQVCQAQIELPSKLKIKAAHKNDDESVYVLAISNDKQTLVLYSAKNGLETQEYSWSTRSLSVSENLVFSKHTTEANKIDIFNFHQPSQIRELSLHHYTFVCFLNKDIDGGLVFLLVKTQKGKFCIIQIAQSYFGLEYFSVKKFDAEFTIQNYEQVLNATYLYRSQCLVLLYHNKAVYEQFQGKVVDLSEQIRHLSECPLRVETNSQIVATSKSIYFVEYENQDIYISKIEIETLSQEQTALKIQKICTLHGHILQLSMTLTNQVNFYVLRRTNDLPNLELVWINYDGIKGIKEQVSNLGTHPEIEENLRLNKSFVANSKILGLNESLFQIADPKNCIEFTKNITCIQSVNCSEEQFFGVQKGNNSSYFVCKPYPDYKHVITHISPGLVYDIFFLRLDNQEYVLVWVEASSHKDEFKWEANPFADQSPFQLNLFKLNEQFAQYCGTCTIDERPDEILQNGQHFLLKFKESFKSYLVEFKENNFNFKKNVDLIIPERIQNEKAWLDVSLDTNGKLTFVQLKFSQKSYNISQGQIYLRDNLQEKSVNHYEAFYVDVKQSLKQNSSPSNDGKLLSNSVNFSHHNNNFQIVIQNKFMAIQFQDVLLYLNREENKAVNVSENFTNHNDSEIQNCNDEKSYNFQPLFVSLPKAMTENGHIGNSRYQNIISIEVGAHLILWDLEKNVQAQLVTDYKSKSLSQHCQVQEHDSKITTKCSWSGKYKIDGTRHQKTLQITCQSSYLDVKIAQQLVNNLEFTDEHMYLLTEVLFDGQTFFHLLVDQIKTKPLQKISEKDYKLEDQNNLLDQIIMMICYQNDDGDSSLSHALKTQNYEAFELLLSIVMKSETTFISRTFISELEKVVNRNTEGTTKFLKTYKCSTQPKTGLMKIKGEEEIFLTNSTFLEFHNDNAGNTVYEQPSQDFKTSNVIKKIAKLKMTEMKNSSRLCVLLLLYMQFAATICVLILIYLASWAARLRIKFQPEPKVCSKVEIQKKNSNNKNTFTNLAQSNDKQLKEFWNIGCKQTDDSQSNDFQLRKVEINILEFNWLLENKNGKKFIEILARTENKEIFEIKQIEIAINVFWRKYYKSILLYIFVPYVIYHILVNILFIAGMGDENKQLFGYSYLRYLFEAMIYFFVIFFIGIEIAQITVRGKTYFNDYWNLLYWISLLLNPAVMIASHFSVDQLTLKILCAICVLNMWLKLFSWMKLFKQTASNIQVIKEIIQDIKPFLIMLSICIFMFNREKRLPSLAIMGSTLSRVSKTSSVNGNQGKVTMMHDFIWLIDIEKVFRGYNFVFYVKLVQSEKEDLKGMISELKKNIVEQNESGEKRIKQEINRMKEDMNKMKEEINSMKEDMNSKLDKLIEKLIKQ